MSIGYNSVMSATTRTYLLGLRPRRGGRPPGLARPGQRVVRMNGWSTMMRSSTAARVGCFKACAPSKAAEVALAPTVLATAALRGWWLVDGNVLLRDGRYVIVADSRGIAGALHDAGRGFNSGAGISLAAHQAGVAVHCHACTRLQPQHGCARVHDQRYTQRARRRADRFQR